jgi:general secretion pathway protein N
MSKPRKYLIAGSIILVFCLFALIRLPASLLLTKLPAQWRVDGCEGTLWSGRATALGLGGQALQQNIEWRFMPSALFSGRAGWDVRGQYRNDRSQLTVLLSPKQLEVRNLELALPLEPLLAQDPKLKVLRFGGVLRITAPQFISSKPYSINARLENFFSALTANAGPLGSYRMTLNMLPDQSGDWQLSHTDGVLNASGQGKIDGQAGLSGQIKLKPDENAAAYLQTMLAMLPRNEDTYVLNLPMR